jgi:hypothetical protein
MIFMNHNKIDMRQHSLLELHHENARYSIDVVALVDPPNTWISKTRTKLADMTVSESTRALETSYGVTCCIS